MVTKIQTLVGAHISGSKSLHNTIADGASIGCNTIQVFTKNNRQWSFQGIDPQEAILFREAQKHSPIGVVVSHASYLINLGSPKKDLVVKSIKGLAAELSRCEQLAIPYLVIHPGARLESSEVDCIKQIAEGLSEVLENNPGPCTLLLENTAGQGSVMGYRLEQLAAIKKMASQHKRIGFCIDTCHAFAAGYDFRTPKTYKAFWQEIDDILGKEHVHVIHVNDSAKELGSRVDRHAGIGTGKLGLEPFRLLMNDVTLRHIPKILETPHTTLAEHKKNLDILLGLIQPNNTQAGSF